MQKNNPNDAIVMSSGKSCVIREKQCVSNWTCGAGKTCDMQGGSVKNVVKFHLGKVVSCIFGS